MNAADALEKDEIEDLSWKLFNPGGNERVQRLSEAARALARRYLSGEIGRSMQACGLSLPASLYLEIPSANRLYAEAARMIAENAPLRIIEGEKLAGAATLKEATAHAVPILRVSSVSHTTLGFEKALSIGYRGIREEIERRMASGGLSEDGMDLLNAMLSCVESAKIWHRRHVEELEKLASNSSGKTRQEYEEILGSLRSVPENPPRTFREALQSLWLLWDFQRLCGNWSGIGRFDKMLGPYLARDLKEGRLSLEEARELIAHFWIKGCEWTSAGFDCPEKSRGSGDAQFYQNIVLAGVDESGNETANDVTYLVLDVVEELHISDFPVAVRLSRKSPEKLLRRVAELQRRGGGAIAVYNEDRIIPTLIKFGYPIEEARNFANDGCWEILIPGKTCFSYQPFDALKILQETLCLGAEGGSVPAFGSFEELYADFKRRMAFLLTASINSHLASSVTPTVLADILTEGCIASGRSYHNLGPKYTVKAPHAGGLPDLANSLFAIKKLVYEERRLSFEELVGALRRNWEGSQELRLDIRSHFDFYGNDSEESDAMLRKVFDDFTELVGKVPVRNGVLRPAGISTFGRECSDFLKERTASAAGTLKGDILASNLTPSPGTDKRGPTAALKSHCCADFSKLPCGTALDLKIHPSSLRGESGLRALTNLMRAFVELGGVFMQIDAVDSAMLRDAQAHPEKYPNLSVRVSGWSARFATLSRNWQEMLISRSEHNVM